jgi:hypothetical protein
MMAGRFLKYMNISPCLITKLQRQGNISDLRISIADFQFMDAILELYTLSR